jgi:hypothetical protein
MVFVLARSNLGTRMHLGHQRCRGKRSIALDGRIPALGQQNRIQIYGLIFALISFYVGELAKNTATIIRRQYGRWRIDNIGTRT